MLRKKSGAYIIRNSQSSKVYIGSAENLKRRKKAHFGKLYGNRHENGHLQNSYNKHGKDCFTFEVLERCTMDVLIEREQKHMDCYEFKELYNINPTAGSSKGMTLSKTARNKMSRIRSNISDETRAKMSASRKGVPTYRPNRLRNVQQFKNGSLVFEYENAQDCSENIDYAYSTLCKALRTENKLGGYTYKYS